MISAHERERLLAQYGRDPARAGTLVLRSVIGLALVAGLAFIGARPDGTMEAASAEGPPPRPRNEASPHANSNVSRSPDVSLASRDALKR